MELVYLWVEDYKNIQKQGFNFSPRFRCDYDEEKNELKIVDKDETGEFYLKNFFGDNINVTAIVGENGSGKSRMLESLFSILNDNNKIYKYLIIVKDKNDDLILCNGLDKDIENIDSKIQKKEISFSLNIIEKYKTIAFLFITNEYIEETFLEKIEYPSEQSDRIKTYEEKESINIRILKNAKKFENVKFIQDAKNFFLPTKIRIRIEDFKGLRILKDKEQEKIEELKKVAGEVLEKNEYKEYLKKVYEILEVFRNSESFPKSHLVKTIDSDYIYGFNVNLSEKYNSVLNNLEKISFGNNIFYEFTITDIDEEKLEFLSAINNINIFKIELLDNDKSFYSLSYGERQLLNQLHLILSQLDWKKINTFNHTEMNEETQEPDESYENVNIEKYFIFIDEFELGLHPNWQKKALSYLIDFLKVFNIKIDLFITSHSPFILSDLPKENIIFLEKGKQVYPFEDGKQTFGANIHTLLSHGFFMKDGLMGEFAKSKIDLAIKYLNQKVLTQEQLDYCENIIPIIGEPIIKRELQKMLDSKRLSEIEQIKKEIKALEERMTLIWKNSK